MYTDQTGKVSLTKVRSNSWTENSPFRISGAATVRIAMPSQMQSSLIFHYNLKFYDNDGDSFDGVSLKRFVMQVRSRPSEAFVAAEEWRSLPLSYRRATFLRRVPISNCNTRGVLSDE